LNPAVILLSAWWGQYESVYTAPALVAIVLAVEGRAAAGGAAIALSVMTKPQALPFIVPFGAWVGGRYGLRRLAAAAGVGALVIVALWLPFVAAGGPMRFLGTLSSLQGDTYSWVAINAWNLWGLVQGFITSGSLAIPDSAFIAGPISARALGFGGAGLLTIVLAVGMARRPSHATLVVGMTAGALVAFVFLTTMHERYLYPAVVLPLALVWWRPARLLWLALCAAYSAELIWALQATEPFVGLGSVLDMLRVPVSLFMVVAAAASVATVVLGRLPTDRAWDRAVGER
jgi:Gpi18-like mannosyltransferase